MDVTPTPSLPLNGLLLNRTCLVLPNFSPFGVFGEVEIEDQSLSLPKVWKWGGWFTSFSFFVRN